MQWQSNTIVAWDNWGSQHQAIWDYYPFNRWGERVSAVAGIRPTAVKAKASIIPQVEYLPILEKELQ